MADPLRQLSLTFAPEEDRLLLRIVTAGRSAYKLWLTRRVTGRLAEALDGAADQGAASHGGTTDDARQYVRDFQREAAETGVDRTQPYDDAEATHPLGDAPVLVIDIRTGASGPLPTLSLDLKDKPAITLGLEQNLIHTLSGLLASGSTRAGWGLHETEGELLASANNQRRRSAVH